MDLSTSTEIISLLAGLSATVALGERLFRYSKSLLAFLKKSFFAWPKICIVVLR